MKMHVRRANANGLKVARKLIELSPNYTTEFIVEFLQCIVSHLDHLQSYRTKRQQHTICCGGLLRVSIYKFPNVVRTYLLDDWASTASWSLKICCWTINHPSRNSLTSQDNPSWFFDFKSLHCFCVVLIWWYKEIDDGCSWSFLGTRWPIGQTETWNCTN